MEKFPTINNRVVCGTGMSKVIQQNKTYLEMVATAGKRRRIFCETVNVADCMFLARNLNPGLPCLGGYGGSNPSPKLALTPTDHEVIICG